jgi:hypothetical protein
VDDPGFFLIMLGALGVGHLPLIVIAIVGIVLAGRRVADNPRAARLARAGCIVLLVAEVLALLQPFLLLRPMDGGLSIMGGVAATGLLTTVMVPVAVGLLVAAAVGRRRGGPDAPGGSAVAGFGTAVPAVPAVPAPGTGLTVTPWGPAGPPAPDFGTPDVISSR